MFNFLQNHNTYIIRKYQSKIDQINQLASKMQKWSDSELQQQTE